MSEYLYPRKPPVVLIHPVSRQPVVPTPGEPVPADDPLVKAFRWAFGTVEELNADAEKAKAPVTEVRVEEATQAPGQRRTHRR